MFSSIILPRTDFSYPFPATLRRVVWMDPEQTQIEAQAQLVVCDLPNSVGLENMYNYYYETDGLTNPRPTQLNPIKIRLKSGIWATSSHSKMFFSWVGIGFI